MARFMYAASITAIAQSIAGTTALQSGPTGILRNKIAPARVTDFYSLKNRAAFLQLVKLWTSALTNNQRLSWIALGANRKTIDVLGNPVPLNGLGAFVRFNLPLLQANYPINFTPPIDFTTTAISTVTFVASSITQSLQLTALGTNIAAHESLAIALSTTRPPGYTSAKHRPRILARAPGPVALPVNLTAAWIPRGGTFFANTKLIGYIRVLNINSGFYGPKLLAIVTVT